MAPTRYLLVGNPTAQSGLNGKRIERAHRAIEEHGAHCELFDTLPGGATISALAARLRDGAACDVVVAMGGDGTFREVGAGLLASGCAGRIAMGMLPTGTANDQGRSFGLDAGESALESNVDVLCRNRTTPLDGVVLAGLAHDGSTLFEETFFDSAGWGFSARVLLERNIDRSVVEKLGPLKLLYRDHLVYAGAFSRVFFDSFVRDQTFDAHVVIDGTEHEFTGLSDLVIKNTRIFAGAWILDRTSAPDDGLVELVPFRNQADWIAKGIIDHQGNMLPDAMRDPLGAARNDVWRGARFDITLRAPVLPLAQIDGEEANPSPRCRVTVLPRAITLVVP